MISYNYNVQKHPHRCAPVRQAKKQYDTSSAQQDDTKSQRKHYDIGDSDVDHSISNLITSDELCQQYAPNII
jgi:hypothetical protein